VRTEVDLEWDHPTPGVKRIGETGLRREAELVDIVAVCRHYAVENGGTLEAHLWEVMRGLMFFASQGDAKAAEVVLRHLAKPPAPQESKVEVTHRVGPPIPSPEDMAVNMAKVAELARDYGITTVDPEDPDVAPASEGQRIQVVRLDPPSGAAEDILTELCG
jgi:hypothetical protein